MKNTRAELELIHRGLDMLRTVLVLDLHLTKEENSKVGIKSDIERIDSLKRKTNVKKAQKLLDQG